MSSADHLAPTKSNLMRLRDQLKVSRMGYNILDEKRNILVMELMKLIQKATEQEQNARELLKTAYSALEQSVMASGRLAVAELTGAISAQSTLSVTKRKVMGVSLPDVTTSFNAHAPYVSPMGLGSDVSEEVTIERFLELLEAIGGLAQTRISVLRLAMEVKKTIKKVNGLGKFVIPGILDQIKFMKERLEEADREMFTTMKKVKERLEARNS